MNLDLDTKNIFIGLLLFFSSSVVYGLAIIGAVYDKIDPFSFEGIDVQVFLFIYIPLCIYFAIFTKFNNPFSKQEKINESH